MKFWLRCPTCGKSLWVDRGLWLALKDSMGFLCPDCRNMRNRSGTYMQLERIDGQGILVVSDERRMVLPVYLPVDCVDTVRCGRCGGNQTTCDCVGTSGPWTEPPVGVLVAGSERERLLPHSSVHDLSGQERRA